MSLLGKITTLFADKDKTQRLYPRTKTQAVTNDAGEDLDTLLAKAGIGDEAMRKTEYAAEEAGVVKKAEAAINAEKLGEQLPEYYAPAVELCNRNLLDNWYFGNPVNQRNFTSGSGKIIDRWVTNGDCTANFSGETFTITTTGSSALRQRLEKLPNGKYTLSYLSTGEILSATLDWNGISAIKTVAPNIEIRLEITGGYPTATIYFTESGITKTFIAAKLELGFRQTLAHQEGGKWVLNEIPNYAEELNKCQRYFFKSENIYGASLTCLSDYALYGSIQFIQTMKKTPDITIDTIRSLMNGNVKANPNLRNCQASKDGITYMLLDSDSAGIASAGSYVQIAFTANAEL